MKNRTPISPASIAVADLPGVPSDPRLDPARIRGLWARAFAAWYFANYNMVPGWIYRRVASWDGGVSSQNGRRYQSVWPKVAAYCRDEDLDPAILIDALLSRCTREAGARPYPSHLTSEKARSAYDAVAASRLAEPRIVLEQQTSVLMIEKARHRKAGLAEPEAILAALRDPFARFQPLFRYASLTSCGDEGWAARYADKARMQYVNNPGGYDMVWGDLIPATLHNWADEAIATTAALG